MTASLTGTQTTEFIVLALDDSKLDEELKIKIFFYYWKLQISCCYFLKKNIVQQKNAKKRNVKLTLFEGSPFLKRVVSIDCVRKLEVI